MQPPQDVAQMLRLKAAGAGDQVDCTQDGLFAKHGASLPACQQLSRVADFTMTKAAVLGRCRRWW